ncbi:MAG TPA: Gfo/Idh/MocA family oxidoreductase [Pirellulales bacterium]|jgi:predicted dehydrogenase|nr:Gfo/Idh/MocA family oxidoreductase [Pirellulales bacterium]
MSLTRRTFLQNTAAAGVASLALGQTKARAAEAASQKVVVGLMGTSRGASVVKTFAKQPGVEIAYICDVDQQRMQKCASAVNEQTGKAPQTVTDFRRILDDKSVDALIVAAPDHWHSPATIMACAAGKHVYCEKPASHNPREGELMIEAARKHKRAVQLGTQRRSMPALREAVERIRSGDIGEVLVAKTQYFNPRPGIGPRTPAPIPPTLDYALWQGPAPEVPYGEWKEYPSQHFHYHWHWMWVWGTGECGNNGVHTIDVCRWGLGVDYPTRVTMPGGRYRYDDSQETPDTSIATFECGDKMIVWEQRSWYRKSDIDPSYEVAFFGEKGTLTYGGGKYQILDEKGKEIDKSSGLGSDEPHIQNFLDAVRNGASLNAEIAEGVKSTLMCHLANISWRTRRPTVLNPQTHQLDDAEQMKLWSREYRPGWEPKV